MNTKTIKILCFLFLFFSLTSMLACTDEQVDYNDYIKVIYELEGGSYKNSLKPVTQLYKKSENGEGTLIFDLTTLSKSELTYEKHKFDGWYRTKEVVGNKVVYSDPWDFTTDTVDNSGITLYAKWNNIRKYTFNVCYKDDTTGELKSLGVYTVEQYEEFEDYMSYANKRSGGYTPTGNFYTEDGKLITDKVEHPGGEEDKEIIIVAEYIKGLFKICRTKNDLKTAANSNIYLANDIDMEGEYLNLNNYSRKLVGNGHTIKNFKVQYSSDRNDLQDDLNEDSKKSLYISLFKRLTNATIENVNFDNVVIDINTNLSLIHKIYVNALAYEIKGSNLKDVTFNGTITFTKLPDDFNLEERFVKDSNPAIIVDDKSVLENVIINIKEKTNE